MKGGAARVSCPFDKHFLKQLARNSDIRPHGIVDSFTVESAHHRSDDTGVQKPLELAARVVRKNQIGFVMQERPRYLANPFGGCPFKLAGNDAATSSLQFLGGGKNGLI